ncbi:epidermal differentiation-specific protein-like [Trichomycterus rosablanca]|uniref:epidermal differentiation-specific protein-like n=1 Tax=Trichomycterus rosablanca TaxID=2290929 RepID=UPI002F34F51C
MNKIIVYEHINFGGLSKEYTTDVANLKTENFNDTISSLKVIGNPWVTYNDINFGKLLEVYEEGEYTSIKENDKISSLQLMTEDLSNPQITLYEHADYKGRSIVLTTETKLSYGNFNDIASSHKVQKGVWVLYQHVDRRGDKMLARAGHDVPGYKTLNDRISQVRPLKAGRPFVTAELMWEQRQEQERSITIDSICGVNYGTTEQTFTTELSREYEGSSTESFNFSHSTQVSVGVTFTLDLLLLNTNLNLSVNKTFTIEKGKSVTRTERKSIKVSLPAIIRPKTKLTVNVVRKELDVIVPVKLTIYTGFQTVVEYGEYRCQWGNSINSEYKEEQIQ